MGEFKVVKQYEVSMEPKQDRMIGLMKEILQDDYVHMAVKSYHATESLEEQTCRISCHLVQGDGSELAVEGEGVGTIDAFFNALRDRLSDDYPSLKSIEFSQFVIRGLISSDDNDDSTKAEAEATVGIGTAKAKSSFFRLSPRL